MNGDDNKYKVMKLDINSLQSGETIDCLSSKLNEGYHLIKETVLNDHTIIYVLYKDDLLTKQKYARQALQALIAKQRAKDYMYFVGKVKPEYLDEMKEVQEHIELELQFSQGEANE